MRRWWILGGTLAALVLVLAAVKGIGTYLAFREFAAQGAQKFTVSTMKARYQDWQPQLGAVGSVRAERGTDVSAEVPGIVSTISFQSGDNVKAGAALLSLRAADDLAHLEALRATASLAQINYERDKNQFEAQAISQAQLDTDAANLRSARAQVAEQEALVAKKQVRAPFAGQIGIRQVDIGQYLAAGTKIATLQQLDPVFVDFTLPQQSLTVVRPGQPVSVSADAFPGQSFAGQLGALDPAVDTDTRNVSLRAVLPNREHRLLPGMYVTVSVATGGTQRYLTLPQTAVAYNPYGATVYVVMPQSAAGLPAGTDGKPAKAIDPAALVAKQVFVLTGATRGDQVAILSGLHEGDEVVTSGQIKLRNGALVSINNNVQPSDDPHPRPQER
jgi:membrane fusion protein (multidrug efflux system)